MFKLPEICESEAGNTQYRLKVIGEAEWLAEKQSKPYVKRAANDLLFLLSPGEK